MRSAIGFLVSVMMLTSCATDTTKIHQQFTGLPSGFMQENYAPNDGEVASDFSAGYPDLEKVTFKLNHSTQTTNYYVRKDLTIMVGDTLITRLDITYHLRQSIVPSASGYEIASDIFDLKVNGFHDNSRQLKTGAHYSGNQQDYWGLLEGDFEVGSATQPVLNDAVKSNDPDASIRAYQKEAFLIANREFWQRVYGFWIGRTFPVGVKIDSAKTNIGPTEVWIPTTSISIPCERLIDVVHRGSGDDYHLTVTDVNPGKSSYAQPDAYIKADIYTSSNLETKRLLVTGRLKGALDNGENLNMDIWMSIEKE